MNTEAAMKFERSLVYVYVEEELGSSDIYLKSMTGCRTKQVHTREWIYPQHTRKPKVATHLLNSLERRPEPNFLRPPAPVNHCHWETKPTINPLVVLLVKKNTPHCVVHCSTKRRRPNGLNWLHTTNFLLYAWIGNIRSAGAQNRDSAWSKDAQALTILLSMAPKEIFHNNASKRLTKTR